MSQLTRRGARGLLAALMLLAAPLAAADGDPLGGGFAPFDLGGGNADTAAAVAVQPDGKVIVLGTVATGAGTFRPALARFLPDGTLDAAFGTGGRVIDPLGIGNQTGAAVHLLRTGRILVAGTHESGPAGNSDFYVLRLLEDGSVDGTFGSFGFTLVPFDLGGDLTDTLAAMTVDRNDRILVAGAVDVSPTDIDFGVARLLAGGGLDTDFSGDGMTTVPVSTAGGIDGALAITYHTTGIVVGGATWATDLGGHFDFALARLAGDGSLDAGFGSGGRVVMPWALGGTNNDFCWGLGIWPDGEIVAASDVATAANEWKWMLQRFSPNGTYLDGVLGTFCDSPTPPCPAPPQDSPRALLLQGDGKVLIAGFASGASGTRDFAVARFHRALGFDASFGAGGTRTHDLGWGIGSASDTGTAMAFDRDGRIVVAGSAEWSGLDTDFAWARFDSSYIYAEGFDWPGGTARWSSTVP